MPTAELLERSHGVAVGDDDPAAKPRHPPGLPDPGPALKLEGGTPFRRRLVQGSRRFL